ncbi:MAG TPA: hypothetical protein VIK06_09040 [Candidatus Limnocylindrales bacterium]|jgi:hypothetical protein
MLPGKPASRLNQGIRGYGQTTETAADVTVGLPAREQVAEME